MLSLTRGLIHETKTCTENTLRTPRLDPDSFPVTEAMTATGVSILNTRAPQESDRDFVARIYRAMAAARHPASTGSPDAGPDAFRLVSRK